MHDQSQESRGNETAEQMLRRFKKMCEKEGLTKDIKRIAYYEKPSEKRRRRRASREARHGRCTEPEPQDMSRILDVRDVRWPGVANRMNRNP